MPTITVLNNDKVYTYILVEEIPVSIGKGDGCDYVLPALSVDGPQLVIVWNSQKERIEVTRLRPDCEFLLDGKPLGDSAAVWTKQMKLTAGPYLFKHDLEEEVTPVNGDRFVVSVHHNDRHLALTPGRANECLMSVINNSAREVDGSVSVLIDGRSVKWVEGVGRLNPHFGANEDRAVALRFTAPRSSAQKAGNYRATISARSSVSDFGSGSDSINLLIEKFFRHELKVERSLRFNHIFGLVFRAARFNAKVGNQGNCPDSYDLMIEADADSKENTSYLFADTDSPQTELSVESGEARTTQVVVRPPLLWFPMWRRHNFSVQAISHGNHQALSEYGQQNSGTRPVRFTQFSVVWLILAALLASWLIWQGAKAIFTPEIVPSIEPTISGADGNQGRPSEAGEPIKVTWKTNNAKFVDIYLVTENGSRQPLKDGQGKDVQGIDAARGEFIIERGFDKSVDLVLVARNDFSSPVEKRIPVVINFPEAKIDIITENPKRLRLNETGHAETTVEWQIIGGKFIKGVTFDGKPAIKAGDKYVQSIFPEGNKQYAIQVVYTNGHEATTDYFQVIVDQPTPTPPPPSPTPSPTPLTDCSLSAIWPAGMVERMERRRNATNIHRGDVIGLKWEVRDADRIKITQQTDGNGPTTLLESTRVADKREGIPPLERSTTFTLIAFKNGQQTICNSVKIIVNCQDRFPNPLGKWKPCK